MQTLLRSCERITGIQVMEWKVSAIESLLSDVPQTGAKIEDAADTIDTIAIETMEVNRPPFCYTTVCWSV